MHWIMPSLIVSTLVAAPAARADDASRLETARNIMVAIHAADNLRLLMPQLLAQLRPVAIQSGQTDQKALDAFLARGLDLMNETAPKAVDDIARSYAQELSEQDLDDILVFYKSKAGHDLIEKQPVLNQRLIAAGREWGQAAARQVREEFAKRAGAPAKL